MNGACDAVDGFTNQRNVLPIRLASMKTDSNTVSEFFMLNLAEIKELYC